jgi:hypothetical protein
LETGGKFIMSAEPLLTRMQAWFKKYQVLG